MKDRIARAKAFAERHRTAITFNAGALVGAGAMTYVGVKLYGGVTLVPASPEALQRLIDVPTGGISWKHPLGTVIAFNDQNPDLLK